MCLFSGTPLYVRGMTMIRRVTGEWASLIAAMIDYFRLSNMVRMGDVQFGMSFGYDGNSFSFSFCCPTNLIPTPSVQTMDNLIRTYSCYHMIAIDC